LKTAERHAKEAGVSEKTIRRDAADAAILESHPKEAEAVMAGDKKLSDTVREIKRETIRNDGTPELNEAYSAGDGTHEAGGGEGTHAGRADGRTLE
jgi:hypothetical protein